MNYSVQVVGLTWRPRYIIRRVDELDLGDPTCDPTELFVLFRAWLREFEGRNCVGISCYEFNISMLGGFLSSLDPLCSALSSYWTACSLEWVRLWCKLGLIVSSVGVMSLCCVSEDVFRCEHD